MITVLLGSLVSYYNHDQFRVKARLQQAMIAENVTCTVATTLLLLVTSCMVFCQWLPHSYRMTEIAETISPPRPAMFWQHFVDESSETGAPVRLFRKVSRKRTLRHSVRHFSRKIHFPHQIQRPCQHGRRSSRRSPWIYYYKELAYIGPNSSKSLESIHFPFIYYY